MKRILLSLIVVAPICAMQPEKKQPIITKSTAVHTFAGGISLYNAAKPMDMGCIISPSPLFSLTTLAVVYGGTELARYAYTKMYMKEESKK
jgi:hypothetical protein